MNAQAERVMGHIPPEQRQSVATALEWLHQALMAEAAETPEPRVCEKDFV